jgi:hypothetical protein
MPHVPIALALLTVVPFSRKEVGNRKACSVTEPAGAGFAGTLMEAKSAREKVSAVKGPTEEVPVADGFQVKSKSAAEAVPALSASPKAAVARTVVANLLPRMFVFSLSPSRGRWWLITQQEPYALPLWIARLSRGSITFPYAVS